MKYLKVERVLERLALGTKVAICDIKHNVLFSGRPEAVSGSLKARKVAVLKQAEKYSKDVDFIIFVEDEV